MILSVVAFLVAFVLALLFGVAYIDFLKKKMFNQYILEDAPKRHQEKVNTPTTGGVFLIGAIIVSTVISLFMAQEATEKVFIAILTLFFFTLTGFRDDYQKISQHQNKGLTPKAKLALQIAISLLPVLAMFFTGHSHLQFLNYNINLGWFYIPFGIFLIVGTSNAVNLTDGLDGLAASNSIVAFLACAVLCLLMNRIDLAIMSASTAGACLGFLYYNKYPAKVFMGDTGSLALGGFLGTIALMGSFELLLMFIGIIFMVETLSVILQVTSFKLTGKRIFKMSPIHHHFELCNWSEVKIVKVFTFITLVFSIIAVQLYRMF